MHDEDHTLRIRMVPALTFDVTKLFPLELEQLEIPETTEFGTLRGQTNALFKITMWCHLWVGHPRRRNTKRKKGRYKGTHFNTGPTTISQHCKRIQRINTQSSVYIEKYRHLFHYKIANFISRSYFSFGNQITLEH